MKTKSLVKKMSGLVVLGAMIFFSCQERMSQSSKVAEPSKVSKPSSTVKNQVPSIQADTAYNIAWDKTEYDFGTVTRGEQLSVGFTFHVVDGKAQITGSATYCGCTVPGWEPTVFYTGDSYTITVNFNTENKMGPFSETVDLFFNRSNVAEKLTVKGRVVNPS